MEKQLEGETSPRLPVSFIFYFDKKKIQLLMLLK